MYNNSRLNKDIDCKRCSEVNQTLIYQAFINGYSDYPIPMKISMEHFLNVFLDLKEILWKTRSLH